MNAISTKFLRAITKRSLKFSYGNEDKDSIRKFFQVIYIDQGELDERM